MASHADTFGHRCPDCGADSTAQMWPVIDAADDPELLRRLTTGDLLHGMCPHCRAAYLIAYPATVLVHRPALRPPLLFGVLPRTPPERQERYLATALVRLGRPPKGMDVEIVPIGLLPVVADRDVETDLAAVRDGTFHGLSPRLQEYADWLRALDHERWKAALQGPLSALLDAAGPAECRRLVEEHPQLLTDEVDELLAQIIEVAEQDHGTPTADIARHRRMLLQQCRRLGTAAVFGGHPPPPPPPSAEPGLSGAAGAALLAVSGHRPTSPDELRDLLTRALLEISPPEAGLHLSIEDELIGLADFFALQLAEELVKHPRDPADFTEAMRLCARLDGLRDSAPVAWAMAQHNGALARGRAAPPGDITALDEARAGFERALTVRTAAARPQDWAVTVIALANLLTGDYPSHLTRYTDEAIRLLEQAVDTAVPLEETDRRSLRFTYGSALLRRAERGDDDALTRATAELERLRDGTRDELFPLVRSNLGMALSRRAERTGRHADWRRAVEVLRETVGAGTADERQLIGSMGNLGIALRHSGEVEEAVALFGRAIERCAAAGWWVAWAGMQNNLGTALLDRVTGDRDENVAAAVEAYEQARLVWTRERFPAEWAQTTARLAAAHDELPGGRQRAGELFGEAVATIPRDRYLFAWVRLTNRYAGHFSPAAALTGNRVAAE